MSNPDNPISSLQQMSATCSRSVVVGKVKKVAFSCFQDSILNLYNVRTKVGLTMMITKIMLMIITARTTTRQFLEIHDGDNDDECEGDETG